MDSTILWMLLLQVALIALNALFACAEIAVISVNENKIEKMAEQGNGKAARLLKLIKDPSRFLATIQVAITLSGFLGSAFAADNFAGYLVDGLVKLGVGISPSILNTISVVLITIILSYFTLVFGELVPKQIAMRKKETMALSVSGLISTISKLFAPLVSLLTISCNEVLRLCGIDPNQEDDTELSEEEIRLMAEAGSLKGTIDQEENTWIQNVFEFDDLAIESIMTHRKDVTMLDAKDPIEVWDKTILESKRSQFPIFKETKDSIVGILNAKDYFRLKDGSKENVWKRAVRKPYFVPENMKADVLFKTMKKDKQKLVVVLDEYGGVSGVVTMNDLVEELVGDFNEEESPRILPAGIDRWKVLGNVPLDAISEITGVDLDENDNDSFNGMMYQQLGRVPEDGERCSFVIKNLQFDVFQIENHEVKFATIIKIKE
ncbi:hemolysin family protein [Dubosiella newyorkensis]|uniref:hemolysin family protein n=1 Tax=Dubosiella newyorkensis TaxID=1862672 RepID=UPI0027315007|nr:hemolysin family protein [Dubosiella newyorkensis]